MANTMKDLSGQRFGKLIALKPTEERKNGFVMWECKCDCGNTAYVLKTNLKKGFTRSCGCLHQESANRNPVRDLTGQRFGKLVLVGPTEQRKGSNVVWECKCDCGNTTFATTNVLTNGNKRSCGCLNKEYVVENVIKDLTGQRFGKLVAIKPTDERKNGYVVWECKCDCGSTTYVPTSLLTSGNTSSCGCLKKLAVGGKQPKDLTGQRFGRLVALRPIPERKNGYIMWECQCDCGRITKVIKGNLANGGTQSCGCLRKEKTKET